MITLHRKQGETAILFSVTNSVQAVQFTCNQGIALDCLVL